MRWEVPRSPSEIRSFLDLVGYYRRFIRDLSKIDAPLTRLTRKDVTLAWGSTQQTSFETMHQRLCEAPVLAHPEGVEDVLVYCDASISGMSVVLMQRGHVILNASRQLNPHQTRYHTHIWSWGRWCSPSRYGATICMESGAPYSRTIRI